MKVKMLRQWSSPLFNYRPGAVIDLDDERAKEFIDNWFAVAVDPSPVAPVEQRVKAKKFDTRVKGVEAFPAAKEWVATESDAIDELRGETN